MCLQSSNTVLSFKNIILFSHITHGKIAFRTVAEKNKRRLVLVRLSSLYLLTLQSLLVRLCTNKFNIQQLYALPTPYLCVLYLSENKQRIVPLTA